MLACSLSICNIWGSAAFQIWRRIFFLKWKKNCWSKSCLHQKLRWFLSFNLWIHLRLFVLNLSKSSFSLGKTKFFKIRCWSGSAACLAKLKLSAFTSMPIRKHHLAECLDVELTQEITTFSCLLVIQRKFKSMFWWGFAVRCPYHNHCIKLIFNNIQFTIATCHFVNVLILLLHIIS